MTRSDLDHLRLFASFGKMIIEQNPSANCVPFQQLIFAIRDWDLDKSCKMLRTRESFKIIKAYFTILTIDYCEKNNSKFQG